MSFPDPSEVYKTTVSTFLAMLFFQFNLFGQKGYSVVHYTDDNGMPQNSVRGLAVDSHGFLWIATENGLARFDGQRFNVFDNASVGTRSNRFQTLQPSLRAPETDGKQPPDAPGEIYAADESMEFVKIQNGTAGLDSIYFKEHITTLRHFDEGQTRTFLSVGLPTYLKEFARPIHYIVPLRNSDGSYYVIDSAAVQLYHGDSRISQTAFAPAGSLLWWNYFTIGHQLYYRHDNGTIFGVSKGRVYPVNVRGDLLRDNGYGRTFGEMKIIWNLSAGQVFFYHNKKLYTAQADGERGLATQMILEGFDMEKEAIQSIYRDPATQTLFLGSPSRGLFVLTKQVFDALTVPEGEIANVYYAAVPYDDHHVVTPLGIIIGKDNAMGNYRRIPLLQKLNPGDRRSLFYDKSGNLWVKMLDLLYRIDEKAGKITGKWRLPDEIKHIYPDQEGNVWIATGFSGIYRMNMTAADPQPELVRGKIKGTYLHMWGNRMLAGTTSGLYMFNLGSGNGSLVSGTEGLYIKSLYVDKSKRVWLTASGEGIILLENGKLTRFPMDRNRYLASPHCMVDDGHGFFWVPTNKGLFQVAIKDLLAYKQHSFDIFYLYHSKDEGFLTNEFNGGCQPCGTNLRDGAIMLPSLNGMVWFLPEKIGGRMPSGPVVLDRVLVNRQSLPATGDTLTLPPSPAHVRFFFSTPYYGNAYNLDLAYALIDSEGQEASTDWIPIPTNDFTVPFSTLEHGTHTLLIRKANGFGKDNYTIKRIRVIVPPLWYQTWWAKLLLGALVICIFYLYNTFRTRKILREKARLEEVIAKRTESLNLALRDVEESKDEMTRQVHMLSRLLASMTHDIQSPLNYIMLTSGSIPSLVEKGNLAVVSEIGQVISNSSRRMSDLLRGLLDYIKVHVYNNSIQFEDVNLRVLVENKYELFRNASEQEGNVFVNDVPAGLLVASDAQMLAILVHNLIDNAVKFTQKGTIRISAAAGAGERVTLHIANTGQGIPLHVMEVINGRDNEDGDGTTRSFGTKTGLGLLIVKEVSALINVALHVTSAEGVTCFTLQFNE